MLGGFTLFIALFGGQGFDIKFLLAHLCGGGVVMGAFFMATDYVTSPVSRLGQFIYGCLIGVLGGVFRLYGNTADSFSYAIIIGNVCTPLIDTYIVQKPLAYRKIGKTRPVKREPFRIPKPVIALTLIAAIAGVALSGVYSMTKGTIDLQELQKKTAAYKEVCPEAETFELVDAAEELIAKQDEKASPKINEFYVGKTADGQVAGYAASVTAKGFGGDVTMALGLTPDGAVRKIAFTELNETAGLGMEADKAPFKDQFTGRAGELSLIKIIRNDDISQHAAGSKRIPADIVQAVRKENGRKTGAVEKGVVTDGSDAFRNRDIQQGRTPREGSFTQGGNRDTAEMVGHNHHIRVSRETRDHGGSVVQENVFIIPADEDSVVR